MAVNQSFWQNKFLQKRFGTATDTKTWLYHQEPIPKLGCGRTLRLSYPVSISIFYSYDHGTMVGGSKHKGEINYQIDFVIICWFFFNDFVGFYFSGCSSHVHRFGFSGKIPYRLPHPVSIFVLNQKELPRRHLSQLETRIQRSANDVCYYHGNPVVEKTRWSKFDS